MSALPFLHDRQFSPRLSLVCLVCLLLLPACPAPGSGLDGTAHNHHAQIRAGDAYSNVYGVMAYGDSARARYGTVVNDGGQAVQAFGGWCYGGVADTAYNSVVVHQGLISNNVYGGFADGYQTARSTSNTVLQTGGDVSHVVGGHADSGRGKALADSNLVIIEGGTAGTVVGGYASGLLDGSARYNLVSISGGSITSVVGGNATTTQGTADASFNAVLVNGGRIRSDVIGGLVYRSSLGQAVNARYNAITLVRGQVGGYVFGSALTDSLGQNVSPLPAAGSGNSLNLLGWQGTLRRVAAFQYLNLALPNGMRPGETLLTLGNEQTGGDLQGGAVRVLGALGGQGMRIGDRYTLINSIHADELALSNGGTVHDAPKGFALLFDGSMQRNGDSIDLTITGLRANPQIKAFNQYRVAQMAALDRGARLVEGTAMEQARKAAAGQDAWMPFAAIHGGTERYGNDGRADGTGLELAAGLARSFTGEAGDLLLGAFFEYGQASIGTREDFSVGDVCGTGSARYAGGGLMARFDLTSDLLSGLYAQAGLRLGQINGDWQSQDIASALQQTADFDTSTAYYGLFAGLGYQWQATERMRLDSRASFFWNHQDGQDISIMGEDFRFDPMDSCLLRVGTRLSYELFQGFSPYAGVAAQHLVHQFLTETAERTQRRRLSRTRLLQAATVPDDVVPAALLPARGREMPQQGKARRPVQGFARLVGHRDAAIGVDHALQAQQFQQGPVQGTPHAAPTGGPQHIDGTLHVPAVGRPFHVPVGIGIAQHLPRRPADQPGIFRQHMMQTRAELRSRGHLVFEGDGRVPHIGRIDGQHGEDVAVPGHLQAKAHRFSPPPGMLSPSAASPLTTPPMQMPRLHMASPSHQMR